MIQINFIFLNTIYVIRRYIYESDVLINKETAKRFLQYMKKYPHFYETLAEKVIQYTALPHPIILDIGAGPGLLLNAIHKKMPKAILIGIDPSIHMLFLALKTTKNNSTELIQATSEHLPLKQNSVDMVVIRFSLVYWQNPEKTFQMIYNILKPKGTLLLETLNRTYPPWKLTLVKYHMLLHGAGREVITYHSSSYSSAYTFNKVQHFLTTSHFSILDTEYEKHDWKFLIIAEKG